MPTIKEKLAALAKADKPDIAAIRELLEETAIAVGKADGMEAPVDSPMIEDMWTGDDAEDLPSRERLMIARRAAAARGGDAPVQTREHSNFATQEGVTELAERLGRMVEGQVMMKSVISKIAARHNSLHTLTGAVAKQMESLAESVGKLAAVKAKDMEEAKPKEDEDETKGKKEKDDEEKAKSFLADRAQQSLAAARAAIAKADRLDGAGNAEAAEKQRAVAKGSLEGAFRMAAAAMAAGVPKMDELAKSVTELAKAEGLATNQDIWPDSRNAKPEGDRDTAAKADAKTDTAETTRLAAVEKAVEAFKGQIGAALEGTGVMTAKMDEVFNIIRGAAKAPTAPPMIAAKSEAALAPPDVSSAVQTGRLTESEAATARQILTARKGADAGVAGMKDILETRTANAPANVREFLGV